MHSGQPDNPGLFKSGNPGGPGRPRGSPNKIKGDFAQLIMDAATQTGFINAPARRVDRAGHASWLVLVYYMRGTVLVAAIHAIVVGVALWIMGVPLALPLAVVVFVAAFVPLVGLLAAGALAIVVTLATKGWVDAVVLLGILIIEDQLEAHLLQPQVVGKMIRLHPLAVILSPGGCGLVGLAVGIWAFVVLLSEDVRTAFRAA